MRKAFVTVVLAVVISVVGSALQCFGVVLPGCAGGVPVSSFRLLVEPPKGGPAIPVTSVNVIRPGDKLKYEPVRLPTAIKHKARIALILVPASAEPSKDLKVLEAKPAKDAAEWDVPVRASVLGVVFGPQGLDVKKVSSLVSKNPELIPQLTAYAEQTGTVEALVQTLSEFEHSPAGTRDLNAALQGFSTQYSIALPKLDTNAPSQEQAALLLRAIMPSLSSYDPLTSGNTAVVQQSIGLAASVAALFFGTPVGLAAGGAALFQNMRTLMSPDTDFRSAFVQQSESSSVSLCSKAQQARARTRTAFLWMLRVPDVPPPKVSIEQVANLPIGWKSTVKIACANPTQLKLLPRAREWQLVSDAHSASIPVKVGVESSPNTLSLDLSQAKLPAGEYHLAAKWDWEPFEVAGTAYLHSFSDFAGAKLTKESQDRLVQGSGPVDINLTGADFEFVDKLGLVDAGKSDGDDALSELSFVLPQGRHAGEQNSIETKLDTSELRSGRYLLRFTQVNGTTHDVPVTVHPPNPRLEHLPLRVNLGESQQAVQLQGSGLERIEAITSSSALWNLAPLLPGARELTERRAVVKLLPDAKKGDQLGIVMTVAGIQRPLQVSGVIQVAGPRPKIVSVNASFPEQADVSLHQGEIPAGSTVSFAIRADNVDSHPIVSLDCSDGDDSRQTLSLRPGDRNQMASLDFVGENALFLSLDPGAIGQSGCALAATVATDSAGASDPYNLGRVVRLPRIARFSLTDERVGNGLFLGTLTGRELQMIEKTGWDTRAGYPVLGIPVPLPGLSQEQALKIELPWPPPAPRSPIYIWLRGENEGRMTRARY